MDLRSILVGGLILVVLSTTCANAFPFSGGNGVFNATVYGVFSSQTMGYYNNGESVFSVDMSVSPCDMHENDNCLVELVDSNDNVYGFGNGNNFGGYGCMNENAIRNTKDFVVPTNTVIKRIKITPEGSDSFSIDLNVPEVPKVSADGIVLSFYGSHVESDTPNNVGYTEHIYKRTFDIKLTNTKKTPLVLPIRDIAFKDTNGWVYRQPYTSDILTLASNESQRFVLEFKGVGEFSKPSEIIVEDVPIDIGAWT